MDADESGTTALSLFVTSTAIHAANVGDSRSILVTSSNNSGERNQVVTRLTSDHSLDCEVEAKRIRENGGVICASGPTKRVFTEEGGLGTAFTRSLGDALAKNLGVVASPDCETYVMPEKDSLFVIASDGIFDFISDDEVAQICAKHSDPSKACRELVGKAYYRWGESEERVDDITVVVAMLKKRPQRVKRLSSKLGRISSLSTSSASSLVTKMRRRVGVQGLEEVDTDSMPNTSIATSLNTTMAIVEESIEEDDMSSEEFEGRPESSSFPSCAGALGKVTTVEPDRRIALATVAEDEADSSPPLGMPRAKQWFRRYDRSKVHRSVSVHNPQACI